MPQKRRISLAMIGPGILVAATGVGAGDLATATVAGSKLGTAILWAVLVGAGLKYVLNEGLTRWQLATGSTLLEGSVQHLGRSMLWCFLGYLLVWSFFVGMALMSACGVAVHALVPVFDDPGRAKIVFGVLQSGIAAGLVLAGGYKLFERVMNVCIAVMFVVCCTTAICMLPAPAALSAGLLIPRIPNFLEGGLTWTVALLGGVGGTVTVLCYGYWIREEGREGVEELRTCRVDLAVGYTMTALFGISMVIIGSQLGEIQGSGASLIVNMAAVLEDRLGNFGTLAKWSFLIGAWGAVFSSLLGVWQSVPYLFVDFTNQFLRGSSKNQLPVDSRSRGYRSYLAALAIVPMFGLVTVDFSTAIKINGLVGAVFIPMLALALLILNGNAKWVGASRNSTTTTLLLVVTLAVFVLAGGLKIYQLVAPT